MTSRDFAYWLQGFFEIAEPTEITPIELNTIRKHLDMVFIHEIDPSFPAAQQEALNNAHNSNAALLAVSGQMVIQPPIKPEIPSPLGFQNIEPGMRC